MTRDSVYFFAEYPIEFAIWSSLAETIRELDKKTRLQLVFTRESRISEFNPEKFLSPFDSVYEVDYVSHEMGGRWRKGLTPDNIHHSLTKVFPKAKKVYAQLSQIDFSGNSLAFTYLGVTLNQALFLKSMRNRPEVESVLFLSADSTQRSSGLTDYVVNQSQSLLLSFYFHFFGTAYMDVYWAKVGKRFRTNTREYVHRTKPADHVFQSLYPFRFRHLHPGQVRLPFRLETRFKNTTKQESIIFIGQPHYFLGGFSGKIEACFYERLNTILNLVRSLHRGQRLVYKSHPGQTEEQLSRINLNGFEVITAGTSEGLFKEDNSISTVYGFSSSSLQTALCYGIRSYYLYRLFDDILMELPHSVRSNWEHRWDSEHHPEMILLSLEDWKSGKNEYSVKDISLDAHTETTTFLSKVGIIKSPERTDSISKVQELSDQRWEYGSKGSSFYYVMLVVLFIPKVVLYFFLLSIQAFFRKLRLSD